MPFFIITGDITKVRTQAIVNAANNTLLGGGGVDGAIHRAAGKKLLEECRTLGGCKTGEAKITSGYNLPAEYVIHTVGPIWCGGKKGEDELLASCYRNSLDLAKQKGIESIAFPLISAGVYRYPKDKALSVAIREIRSFLKENDMTVYMVIYNKNDYFYGSDTAADLKSYLERNYVSEVPFRSRPIHAVRKEESLRNKAAARVPVYDECACTAQLQIPREPSARLDDLIEKMDMSFSDLLIKLIDESGMTDSECYKAANVDRRLFSKIKSGKNYHPSKQTCVAFALALKLSREGTDSLLRSAGYALSNSSKFDVIIEFFINRGIYDIYEINNTLYEYDQPLLGAM